jgi:hypothetical protein
MPSPKTILDARNNLIATITHLMLGVSTLFSLNSSLNKFQSKLCENRTSSLTHLRILSPKHRLRSKPKVCFSLFGLHIQNLNYENFFEI